MTSPSAATGGGDPYRRTEGGGKPSPRDVRDFHTNSDVDSSASAQHHTIGVGQNTAADGAHTHNGTNSRVLNLSSINKNPLTVTGAKAGNAALTSLLTQLAAMGIIVDSTT